MSDLTPRPVDAPVQLPPAGWYPADGQPGMVRWWDGAQWTPRLQPDDRLTVQQPVAVQPPQVVINQAIGSSGGHYVSGLSTGGHIFHGILTLLTCGAWGIVWFMKARLGRKAIR